MRCYFNATVDTSYCITSNFTITVKSQQLLRESKNCLMENDSLMAGCYEHRNTPDEPSPHPHIKFKTHFNIILQSTPRFSFTVCEKQVVTYFFSSRPPSNISTTHEHVRLNHHLCSSVLFIFSSHNQLKTTIMSCFTETIAKHVGKSHYNPRKYVMEACVVIKMNSWGFLDTAS